MALLHLLVLALLSALALALYLADKVIPLVLEKEYSTWAAALARAMVRLAGLVYRSRRGQWRADLLYLQRVERKTGLLEALWCLLTSPWLTLSSARVAARIRRDAASARTRVVIAHEVARVEETAHVLVIEGKVGSTSQGQADMTVLTSFRRLSRRDGLLSRRSPTSGP